jgi:hypothetical protein
MKAADAWRVKLLVDALDQYPDFEKEFRKKPKRQEHKAFEMQIGELETEGPQPDYYVYVDDVTGREIVAAAKKIIQTRLREFGVER